MISTVFSVVHQINVSNKKLTQFSVREILQGSNHDRLVRQKRHRGVGNARVVKNRRPKVESRPDGVLLGRVYDAERVDGYPAVNGQEVVWVWGLILAHEVQDLGVDVFNIVSPVSGVFEDIVEVINKVRKLSRLFDSGNCVSLGESSRPDLENRPQDVARDVACRALVSSLKEETLFNVQFVIVAAVVATEVGELAMANDGALLLVQLLEAVVATQPATAGRQNGDERLGRDQHVTGLHRRLLRVDQFGQ